jgi:hypothetical protein
VPRNWGREQPVFWPRACQDIPERALWSSIVLRQHQGKTAFFIDCSPNLAPLAVRKLDQ